MKKIENIIDNCRECSYACKYHSTAGEDDYAITCGKTSPRMLCYAGLTDVDFAIPDWCPLETYKDAEKSEAQPVTAPCYIGQSKVDEKAPSTVILPGLPHLEWMTENLSGFGGTEIDGRTYYTWEEAMAAVEQLGNGWRLPTRGEMVDLDDLGSEWLDDGPHDLPGRLFGGGLFLDATGYRCRESGALTHVGTEGDVWSSSSAYAGHRGAGILYFDSSYVDPLDNTGRAYGLSVRCVRNVK